MKLTITTKSLDEEGRSIESIESGAVFTATCGGCKGLFIKSPTGDRVTVIEHVGHVNVPGSYWNNGDEPGLKFYDMREVKEITAVVE